MNNDLISREALKKEFEKVYPLSVNDMGGVVNKQIYDIIDNAPAVEIATKLQPNCNNLQPKQGEWIDYSVDFYKCPECGYLLEKDCPRCQNKVILPEGGAE